MWIHLFSKNCKFIINCTQHAMIQVNLPFLDKTGVDELSGCMFCRWGILMKNNILLLFSKCREIREIL